MVEFFCENSLAVKRSMKYVLQGPKYTSTEAATGDVPLKKVLLKLSQSSQGNIYARDSFLIKLQA